MKEKHPQLSSSLFKDFSDQHGNVKISIVPVDMTMLLFLVFLSPNFYHLLHVLDRLGNKVFINIVNNRSALLSPVTPMEVRTLTGNFQKLLAQVFFFIFLCITQVLQTINLWR